MSSERVTVVTALGNDLEALPFFAASSLVAAVTNTHDWLTLWGLTSAFAGGSATRCCIGQIGLLLVRLERLNDWHFNDRCRADGKMTCVSRDLILCDKLCAARAYLAHARSRFIAGPLAASLARLSGRHPLCSRRETGNRCVAHFGRKIG